jgi:protein-S-isoprenylcysteine O-methyltransferase Ste14
MHTLKIAVIVIWVVFALYWFGSAFGAKEGRGSGRRIPLNGITALAVVLLLRLLRGGSLAVHSPALGAVGVLLCVSGIAIAVWARIDLGRNWGMPMTEKAEPELVTSGPYRLVRHPIYSGQLVAVLGTALVTDRLGLAIVAVMTGYFYYCASVEEKNLTATFPIAYSAYRARTRMLIPYVLWRALPRRRWSRPRADETDREIEVERGEDQKDRRPPFAEEAEDPGEDHQPEADRGAQRDQQPCAAGFPGALAKPSLP